jgi:tetratricopeptide (TPR) repeat protein
LRQSARSPVDHKASRSNTLRFAACFFQTALSTIRRPDYDTRPVPSLAASIRKESIAMPRFFPGLAVAFLCCLALPVNLRAQDTAEYLKRANAWSDQGEHDRAIAELDRATRANRLAAGKDWGNLDTLAAAYAESSDFENARLREEELFSLFQQLVGAAAHG